MKEYIRRYLMQSLDERIKRNLEFINSEDFAVKTKKLKGRRGKKKYKLEPSHARQVSNISNLEFRF